MKHLPQRSVGTGRRGGSSRRRRSRRALRLSTLARDLQSWSQRKVRNIKQQLQFAKEISHHLEIAQDSRPLSSQEDWLRRQLKRHALGLASLEQTIARLRYRLAWLKEGDANPSYFYQHARYRKRKNFMAKVRVDDRVITGQEVKKEAVWEFYNSSLGQQYSVNLPWISNPSTKHHMISQN